MNTTPILRATNIVKKLGGKTILNDVSLDVHKGDVKVVIGPSGAGKSTFLQCLNYLLPPDSGDIWLEGKKVNARDTRELCALRQQVGMIFQDFNLIPILTAEENSIMPLLLAVDGRRLSKRDGDESLEHLQARYTPEQIIGRLAYACGLQNAPDPRTPAELADGFSWQRVPQNDIILPEGLF